MCTELHGHDRVPAHCTFQYVLCTGLMTLDDVHGWTAITTCMSMLCEYNYSSAS